MVEQLFESVKFRFESILDFSELNIFQCILKIVLIFLFGVPFVFYETLGIILSLFSLIPLVGIVLQWTVCLLCDLINSLLFYLIMIPHIFKNKNR